jgi:flagellar biosynthesis protein FliQ
MNAFVELITIFWLPWIVAGLLNFLKEIFENENK